MKNRFFSILIIFSFLVILFSCSKPIEKKLAGTWKVEDVQIKSDFPFEDAIMENSKESQKSISYELMEDQTAKIYAGTFSSFEGNWIFRESENAVYMVFSGTYDTILLGTYEEGKLINIQEDPGIKITTIFVKEKK